MSIVEDYKKNGYAVLEGSINDALIGYHDKAMVHKYLRQARAGGKDRAMIRQFAQLASTMQLFLYPQLLSAVLDLGIARPIFLSNPVAHVVADDLWDEGTGAHQDWPALQSGLDTVVAWIPLWSVDADNYPLELVPGSHLNGLLPAKSAEHISEIDTAGMRFEPVPLRRGDALLFSAFTVHRTRTPGKGLRAAFSHRFENPVDPWFIEHGHYSAQSRAIARDVKWAPSAEQVRAVFA